METGGQRETTNTHTHTHRVRWPAHLRLDMTRSNELSAKGRFSSSTLWTGTLGEEDVETTELDRGRHHYRCAIFWMTTVVMYCGRPWDRIYCLFRIKTSLEMCL